MAKKSEELFPHFFFIQIFIIKEILIYERCVKLEGT